MSLPIIFLFFIVILHPYYGQSVKTKKTIDMKKTLLSALKHGSGTIFILLTMLLGGSLHAWGISYDGTTRLYFNMAAVNWWECDGDCSTHGGGNFAYFFDNSTSPNPNAWSAHAVNASGNVYYVIVPSGTWTHVILTRNSVCENPSWETVYGEGGNNKTGDIALVADKNYISSFSQGISDVTWDIYCNAPTPTTGSASSITATTVTLGATVAAAASNPCTPTYVGVKVYSDSGCETQVTSGQTAFTNYAATYSIDITSLTPKTTYFYKAYAISDAGTTEATISRNFTTDCLSGVNKETVSGSTSQNVCLGDATAISVSPSGALTYTYQWYYNTTDSEVGAFAIPGATSASYTPAVVGANYYFCAVGATGGYCEINSFIVGPITVKAKPTLSVSQSSVTNYIPVTVTAKGAEIATWSVTEPSGNSYLHKKNSTSAVFKASVGSGPSETSETSETYTITGTTSESCSGAVTVTVSSNSDNCQ